jgi:hypothetical protein
VEQHPNGVSKVFQHGSRIIRDKVKRAALIAVLAAVPVLDAGLAERLGALTRASTWTLVASTPMRFDTFHPQGMVRVGETWFVSSVDRDGRAGHLFKVDRAGNLLGDLKLVEGPIYHPGGIDYDGRSIWLPLAEYRPDSRSILFRIDPDTMKASEVARVADHIGAIVHDTDDDTLHGVSWGSRRFYRWDRRGRVTVTANPSHYVDYQDCKYIGGQRMVCGGVAELAGPPGGKPFRLGGLDVVDLAASRPVHQVPIALWTPAGVVMTQNPIWLEAHGAGLRVYFLPEDTQSTLYVYDVGGAAMRP